MQKKICIFYGNCQVIYGVYDKLKSISAFESKYNMFRFVNHDRDNYLKLIGIDMNILTNADVFIYQPLNDKHGVYSTNNIKKYLKNDCTTISFPYIYNSALWSVIWENAAPRFTIETFINCGYRNIINLLHNNASKDEILQLYDNDELDFYFEERLNICMSSLKEKEQFCDIKVSNFILDNYKNHVIFGTQNHISELMINYLINNILKLLMIEHDINIYIYSYANCCTTCFIDKYTDRYFAFGEKYNEFPRSNEKIKEYIAIFVDYYKNNNKKFEIVKPIIAVNDDPEKFIDNI